MLWWSRQLQGLALMLLCAYRPAAARLVNSAVLPHGDFAYDPSLLKLWPEYFHSAQQLHHGAERVAQEVVAGSPDVVVLVTPHGLEADWDLAIYDNPSLVGVAEVGSDLDETFAQPIPGSHYRVQLNVSSDESTATAILQAATGNVTRLRGYNGIEPLRLSWGEVLPLRFISPAPAKVVVLGLPLSRYNYTAQVGPGLVAMGGRIGKALESLKQNIAVVVSTDLAHRHWSNTSFGRSPWAEPFDEAVGAWARELNASALLHSAMPIEHHVYSCGFLGMLLLHGMMEATHIATWEPHLWAGPVHPTYYGMLAASFRRDIHRD